MARKTAKKTRGPVRADAEGAARALLRHTLATLAYRAEKVVRDVPDGFAAFRASEATRTPVAILAHMGDLMEWAQRLARGEYRWAPQPCGDWESERARFFRRLKGLDRALASPPVPGAYGADVIFQGPVADALTHVGQLALLRGAYGGPVRPEAYARARIRVGHVGPNQPARRLEFDGDASRPRGDRD